jgi:hypothetical protein
MWVDFLCHLHDASHIPHGRAPPGPGRLSALCVFHRKTILYGGFVWAHRGLNGRKWRFLARAVINPSSLFTPPGTWPWGPKTFLQLSNPTETISWGSDNIPAWGPGPQAQVINRMGKLYCEGSA